MRGVLIDDHDAVARLRHDVGLVQLRPCGAQRPVDEIGQRRLGGRAGIGARHENGKWCDFRTMAWRKLLQLGV